MNNYFRSISVKNNLVIFFGFLILLLLIQTAQANILVYCKFITVPSNIRKQLSTDELVRHISNLKICNCTLRIYEPSGEKQEKQQKMLDYFEQLQPVVYPGNIHTLYKLSTAYLLSWERDFPVDRLSLTGSGYNFLLFQAPSTSSRVQFQLARIFHKHAPDLACPLAL